MPLDTCVDIDIKHAYSNSTVTALPDVKPQHHSLLGFSKIVLAFGVVERAALPRLTFQRMWQQSITRPQSSRKHMSLCLSFCLCFIGGRSVVVSTVSILLFSSHGMTVHHMAWYAERCKSAQIT